MRYTFILLSLCTVAFSHTLEINNIHNGFKLSVEGKLEGADEHLRVLELKETENTIASEDIEGLASYEGSTLVISLSRLEQVLEIDADADIHIFRSTLKPTINLSLPGPLPEPIFDLLALHTLPPNQEF